MSSHFSSSFFQSHILFHLTSLSIFPSNCLCFPCLAINLGFHLQIHQALRLHQWLPNNLCLDKPEVRGPLSTSLSLHVLSSCSFSHLPPVLPIFLVYFAKACHFPPFSQRSRLYSYSFVSPFTNCPAKSCLAHSPHPQKPETSVTCPPLFLNASSEKIEAEFASKTAAVRRACVSPSPCDCKRQHEGCAPKTITPERVRAKKVTTE